MKVRHKLNPPDELWEVLDEGQEYYILQSPIDKHGVSRVGHAKKSHVEIVPDASDRWEDVTGECSEYQYFSRDYTLWHKWKQLSSALPDGYRLRKVQLVKFPFPYGSSGMSDEVHYQTAFIVERKVSHD